MVRLKDVDRDAAQAAAERTTVGKHRGEDDAAFVMRIVSAYLLAKRDIELERTIAACI